MLAALRFLSLSTIDKKRTEWLGFLVLRKTETMAELVEGEGEAE